MPEDDSLAVSAGLAVIQVNAAHLVLSEYATVRGRQSKYCNVLETMGDRRWRRVAERVDFAKQEVCV